MPHVEVEKFIKAPKEKVFSICSDMVSFAKFMPDVEAVHLLEKGEQYSITEWITRLQGRTIRWREREDYDAVNNRIYYKQLEGDLKSMSGEWIFEETDSGTKLTMTMDFEFGLPMLEPVLNPVAVIALRKNLNNMLESIKRKAEAEE